VAAALPAGGISDKEGGVRAMAPKHQGQQERRERSAAELRQEARRLLDRIDRTDDRAARRGLAKRAFALVQKAEALPPLQ